MNEQEKMETQAAEAPLTRTELEEQLGALARQLTERLAQGEAQEQARSQALNQREEELHQREMAALARERLAAHGLPPALAEALRFADAESMEQGIALLEEAFRAQGDPRPSSGRAVRRRILRRPDAVSLKLKEENKHG